MAESVASATSVPSGSERTHRLDHRVVAAAASVAVALAGALAIVLAARRPLSVDEAAIVAALGGGLRETLGAALEHDQGQTAVRALLHPLVAADAPDWALRMPSLAAVLVAAALVLHAGSQLADRFAGIVAGMLLVLAAVASGVASEVGAHALGVLAVALTTSLFVTAMTRQSALAWVAWALVAALAPLAHPACAAILAAQVVALVVASPRVPRVGAAVAAVATVVAGFLVAAAAVERSSAADGGDESVRALALGAARTVGWSPVVLALAALGATTLMRRGSRWQATLLIGLLAGPLVAVTVAAAVLPINVATTAALGVPGAALGAGIGASTIRDVRLAAAAAGLAVAGSLAAIVIGAAQAPDADWRAASQWVEEQRGARETVVVVPPRARHAYLRYAPETTMSSVGRGDGVWVTVRSTPGDAVAAGRVVVPTPRYALLGQRSFGDELVVEHWIRP